MLEDKKLLVIVLLATVNGGGFEVSLILIDKFIGGDWSNFKGIIMCAFLI